MMTQLSVLLRTLQCHLEIKDTQGDVKETQRMQLPHTKAAARTTQSFICCYPEVTSDCVAADLKWLEQSRAESNSFKLCK